MMDNFGLLIVIYTSIKIRSSKSMQYNLKDIIIFIFSYMQVIFCDTWVFWIQILNMS